MITLYLYSNLTENYWFAVIEIVDNSLDRIKEKRIIKNVDYFKVDYSKWTSHTVRIKKIIRLGSVSI